MAAKENKEAALPEGQAEKPRKKSKLKKIIIILTILIMLFGGCGLGAYWWFFMRSPASEHLESSSSEIAPTVQEQASAGGAAGDNQNNLDKAIIERQSDLPRSTGMVLPLPPITVNLSDPNGRRYLKLGLEVEVNADVSAQLRANNSRIRDAVIMLLAGKSYGDVATPDGKVLLKAEIAARLNQILGAQRVVRVYFTDFVVE